MGRGERKDQMLGARSRMQTVTVTSSVVMGWLPFWKGQVLWPSSSHYYYKLSTVTEERVPVEILPSDLWRCYRHALATREITTKCVQKSQRPYNMEQGELLLFARPTKSIGQSLPGL